MEVFEGKWNRECIMRLIYLFEQRPLLWKVNNPEYKDRKKRRAAISEIAEDLNRSDAEILRKLHNLRCQYNSTVRKIQTNTSHESTTIWEYFNSLNFLSSQFEENEVDNTWFFPDDTTQAEGFEEEMIHENSLIEPMKVEFDPLPVASRITTPCTAKKQFAKKGSRKSAAAASNVDDEYQTFGNFVAQELRSLSSERLKKELKLKIQKLIIHVSEKDM